MPAVGGSGRRGGTAAEPAADPLFGGLGSCRKRFEVPLRRQGLMSTWSFLSTAVLGTTARSHVGSVGDE